MKIQMTIGLNKKSLKNARTRYERWRNGSKQSKAYIGILFAMCEGVCPYCDRDMILSFNHKSNNQNNAATLDHTTPLSQLLKHKKYGLEIMCKQCNNKKGSNEA